MKQTFLLACALTSVAFGQSWVSTAVGNDANNCSRSAPCRTFQRAVNVTAAWSEVHVLDPGEYGTVTITQAITIDGGNLATTMAYSGTAFNVQAPAGAVVQLRNLAIHGDGGYTGISYSSGAQLVIENVKVNGFAGNCISSGVSGSGTTDLVIKDSSIDNCSGAGIYLGNNGPVLTAEIINSHVHFANYGVEALNGNINIIGSTFSSPGNGGAGYGVFIPASAYSPSVLLDNCEVSGFSAGVFNAGGAVQVSRTTFSNNTTALVPSVSYLIVSNGNNSFFNNQNLGTISKTVILQ